MAENTQNTEKNYGNGVVDANVNLLWEHQKELKADIKDGFGEIKQILESKPCIDHGKQLMAINTKLSTSKHWFYGVAGVISFVIGLVVAILVK